MMMFLKQIVCRFQQQTDVFGTGLRFALFPEAACFLQQVCGRDEWFWNLWRRVMIFLEMVLNSPHEFNRCEWTNNW